MSPLDFFNKIAIVKLSYIAFCLVVLFTFPVWLDVNSNFPNCPIIGKAIVSPLYSNLDFLIVLSSLILLGIGIFKDRLLLISLGVLGVILCVFLDLNRFNGMTHFFLSYWILYVLSNRNLSNYYTSIIFFIWGVYFWSGVNKLNIHFYQDTYQWLMDCLPMTRPLSNLKWFSYIFPILESIPAVMLLFNRTRKLGIIWLIAMHIYLITIITILHREYMIYVWNSFLIIVLIKLWNFKSDLKKYFESKDSSMQRIYLFVVSILLPSLLWFDIVSSEFGYAMFTGRLTYSRMMFTASDTAKLDSKLHEFLEPYDNLFSMDIDNFALDAYESEPCRIEAVHKKMFQHLAKPFSDTCMLVIARRPMYRPTEYEFVYKE